MSRVGCCLIRECGGQVTRIVWTSPNHFSTKDQVFNQVFQVIKVFFDLPGVLSVRVAWVPSVIPLGFTTGGRQAPVMVSSEAVSDFQIFVCLLLERL